VTILRKYTVSAFPLDDEPDCSDTHTANESPPHYCEHLITAAIHTHITDANVDGQNWFTLACPQQWDISYV
jgi:hypothetical protein